MPNADAREPSGVQRFYRALLRLLPFEFRSDFGRDMEEAFSDERQELLAQRSRSKLFGFWLRTLMDFARTAPREQWDILRQDLRAGAKFLARSPGFAAAAILTLALGIGGSTGIFSVVYAVVLRPLAFPESERVVHVGWGSAEQAVFGGSVSFSEFQALRDNCRSFELVGATGIDPMLQVPAARGTWVPMMASASLFKLVGASAVFGRLPDENDEKPGATPVAVLSYSTWTSLYGRDPNVIGRTLVRRLFAGQAKPVTIVGVLAPDAFKGFWPGDGAEPPAMGSMDRDAIQGLYVYARLAPGVTVDAARAELAALTPGLAAALPKTAANAKAVLRANRLRDERVREVRDPMVLFLCAVLGLLLVACLNVGSLVLARSISRKQEFATRFALGARPFRVARQLLTECGFLAVAGGLVGLALAWAAGRAFVAISPSMPRLKESGIGTPALLFALAAVVVAACTSALVPAFLSSRTSIVDGLRRAGRARALTPGFSRSLGLLSAAQVAAVLVLLAGTGLLVNSFSRLVAFDLGFDARSLVVATIGHNLPNEPASPSAVRGAQQQAGAALSASQRAAAAIDEEITQRVAEIPGVAAVGLTGENPFGQAQRGSGARIADTEPSLRAGRRVASPTALDALAMHVIGGRWFNNGDREGTPLVAVVNQTMAKKLWNGRSPVGARFFDGSRTSPVARQVIGVVADVHSFGARRETWPEFYVPAAQDYPEPAMLVVRKRPGSAGLEKLVAAELGRFGDRISPGPVSQLEDIWWRQLSDARFLTLVVSVFSLLALAIAVVGVHGVLHFSVAQRTREMGIRKALGAEDSALIRLVVGQALRFTLPACLVGLLASRLAAPAIRSLLFGVTPGDPLTLVAAVVLLIAAVVVAAYFPARRASAVDPSQSLKFE